MDVLTTIKDLAVIVGVVVAMAVFLFNRKRAAGDDLKELRAELRIDAKELRAELRADMKAFQEAVATSMKALQEAIAADIKALQDATAADIKEVRADMKAMQEAIATDMKALQEATAADIKALQEATAADIKENARELRADMKTMQEYIDNRVNELRRDIHALGDRLTAVEVRLDERTPPPSWLYAGIPSGRRGAGSEASPTDAPGGGIDPASSPAAAHPAPTAS